MKENHFDQSIGIAFSELAWLLLLGVVLWCCYNMIKYNKMITQKDKQIVEYDKKIEELEPQDSVYKAMTERLNAMQKELDRLKQIEKEYEELRNIDLSKEESALLKIEQGKNAELQKEIRQLKEYLTIAKKSDKSVRKELLGLKGSLQKVAFVLDKSYSMNSDQRWDKTCDIVKTWLTYLNVEKCILLQFSDGVRVIPDDKAKTHQYLEMIGENRQINLEKLLTQLKKAKPSGNTNTYKALKKAMEYEPDTIILFTDGAPNKFLNFGKYDKKQMNAILEEFSKEHVPINIVALGDYFDRPLCQFLRELADSTGGSFIGK